MGGYNPIYGNVFKIFLKFFYKSIGIKYRQVFTWVLSIKYVIVPILLLNTYFLNFSNVPYGREDYHYIFHILM